MSMLATLQTTYCATFLLSMLATVQTNYCATFLTTMLSTLQTNYCGVAIHQYFPESAFDHHHLVLLICTKHPKKTTVALVMVQVWPFANNLVVVVVGRARLLFSPLLGRSPHPDPLDFISTHIYFFGRLLFLLVCPLRTDPASHVLAPRHSTLTWSVRRCTSDESSAVIGAVSDSIGAEQRKVGLSFKRGGVDVRFALVCKATVSIGWWSSGYGSPRWLSTSLVYWQSGRHIYKGERGWSEITQVEQGQIRPLFQLKWDAFCQAAILRVVFFCKAHLGSVVFFLCATIKTWGILWVFFVGCVC